MKNETESDQGYCLIMNRKAKPPETSTTVKGLFKGLRYFTQIFDEEKVNEMQIGLPTDVKHVAHIGSDGPAANPPSWMSDFKPQESENGKVVSRRDDNSNQVKEGVGLQELLPPPEKLKHKKTRRKSSSLSQNGSPPRRTSTASLSDIQPKPSRRKSSSVSQTGSPPRRSSTASLSDIQPKQSRRHRRIKHGSMDSTNDTSTRRRRGVSVNTDMEGSNHLVTDNTAVASHRKSTTRHRKVKGSAGEVSMKKMTKSKAEHSKCKDNNNIRDKDKKTEPDKLKEEDKNTEYSIRE